LEPITQIWWALSATSPLEHKIWNANLPAVSIKLGTLRLLKLLYISSLISRPLPTSSFWLLEWGQC